MADEQQPQPSGSTESIDPKLAALLCYLLSVVGGLVFYLISKDKFVRFHALQSIFLWAIFIFIPFLWWFDSIIWLGYVVVEVVMMVNAYQGKKTKLPLVGDIAERNC